jgi:hypothetical protein
LLGAINYLAISRKREIKLGIIPEWFTAVRAGTNPSVICRVPSGWAVMCDMQFLRGYTILLADPVVASITILKVRSGQNTCAI